MLIRELPEDVIQLVFFFAVFCGCFLDPLGATPRVQKISAFNRKLLFLHVMETRVHRFVADFRYSQLFLQPAH